MKRETAAPNACRVTAQYRLRDADGFVYELNGMGATLAVHVSRSSTGNNDEDWCVAAHNGTDANGIVISESAPTRTEALQRVARSWSEKSFDLSLPRFDWDAITTALVAVRAI